MDEQRAQETVLPGGSATRTGCGVRDGAGFAEGAVCSRRPVVGRAGQGVGVSKRRCGTCSFYQEAGLAGSGWCHHPQRKTTSDLLIMVRRNELACRDQWERDLWEEAARNADGEVAGVAGGHPVGPVQPATAREIVAVIQAETGAGASVRAEPPGSGPPPALEDVVLSETGGVLPSNGARAAMPAPPAWSWQEEAAAPAVRESDTRAAIKKAREAYRDRNRRVARGDVDDYPDGSAEPPVLDGGGAAKAGNRDRADDELPAGGETGGRVGRRAALSFVDARDREEAISAEAMADAPGAALVEEMRREETPQAGVLGQGSEEADDSSGSGLGETWPPASPEDDGRDAVAQGGWGRGALDPDRRVGLVRERARLVAERPLLSAPHSLEREAGRGGPRPWRFGRPERVESPEVALAPGEGHEERDVAHPWAEFDADDGDSAPAHGRDREEDLAFIEQSEEREADSRPPIFEVEDDAGPEPAEEPILTIQSGVVELGGAADPRIWTGRLPQICRTCRDYRPAEGGERGWCANQWAFSHRRMVAAEDERPCESSLGSWWLPVDEVWAGGVDIAAHGQPTPLLDAFLPHHRDEPRRERRRS